MKKHSKEIVEGKRFEFGKNWNRFLAVLNDERIFEAEKSLKEMLECDNLNGKTFLDIGSGSGIFSLAARRLGAKVYSFDYDPQSVSCTSELRRRYFYDNDYWEIKEGSILDLEFIKSLGKFDIVYSWGVLHHTGNMWKALGNSLYTVKNGGLYFIAIYNDQGHASRFWKKIKQVYCTGFLGKLVVSGIFFPYFMMIGFIIDVILLKNPLNRYSRYMNNRGMSVFYDWIDWLGGYPFEVAKPEDIFDFCKRKGFRLLKMKTTNGLGNNQFIFRQEMDIKRQVS